MEAALKQTDVLSELELLLLSRGFEGRDEPTLVFLENIWQKRKPLLILKKESKKKKNIHFYGTWQEIYPEIHFR